MEGLLLDWSWLRIDFVGDFEGDRVEEEDFDWCFLGEGREEDLLFSLVSGSDFFCEDFENIFGRTMDDDVARGGR